MEYEDLFNITERERRINHLRSIADTEMDIFSEAIVRTEVDLDQKMEKLVIDRDDAKKELEKLPAGKDGIPTKDEIRLYEEISDYEYDESILCDYLTAFNEMKIVYLFKSLEINMKNLIQTAYPNVNVKDFFQWGRMVSFFKSIDVRISEISGYQEAVELRKVNNCIKHSNILSEEIKKIDEFKGLETFTVYSINTFHRRILLKIEDFFRELTELVIKNLFEFDTERLKNMSDEYYNRMNKETFKLFIDNLSNKLK